MKYILSVLLALPAVWVLYMKPKHAMDKPGWMSSPSFANTVIAISLGLAVVTAVLFSQS